LKWLNPGFLTICRHTLIALPNGMSASAWLLPLNQAAAGALARLRLAQLTSGARLDAGRGDAATSRTTAMAVAASAPLAREHDVGGGTQRYRRPRRRRIESLGGGTLNGYAVTSRMTP
jgi:hypothetical protein